MKGRSVLALQGMKVGPADTPAQADSIFSMTSYFLCPLTTIMPASTASIAVC
ncbi:hypothetical protein [Curtobacterium sp. MCBA15_009]|uniref:hypothetical protein n=1 Tax=Curtobacterium sp. MCBA15_009 TaxID=1898737 RepID=UPI001587A894|nr:hypothetical protein [Curtobacterium sp. MCBA15_009]